MRSHLFSIAVQLLGLFFLCWSDSAQSQNDSRQNDSLVLVPSATDIKRSDDGCQELDYAVAARYPGTEVLALVSERLRQQGWVPAHAINRRWMRNPGVFKLAGRWEHFESIAGGTTYLRAEQWTNKAGDLVSYNFWYKGSDLTNLEVYTRYCAFQQVEEHRCVPGPQKPHDEKAYSLAMKITRIEPLGRDFKVSVRIENNGAKPVLIGVNGKLPDGSPELWVLDVEQKEQSEWGYVGVVCAEHPAFDWITLKPGGRIESWAMAVDFPEPDHRWAMCQRKIAHLQGQIRMSISYYPGVCEIENPEKHRDRYTAISEPVELPSLQP